MEVRVFFNQQRLKQQFNLQVGRFYAKENSFDILNNVFF